MSVRAARTLVIVYLVALTIALTWPGVLPFNRVRPLVLGLPFALFWSALWVAIGAVFLLILERAITREEDRSGSGRGTGGA